MKTIPIFVDVKTIQIVYKCENLENFFYRCDNYAICVSMWIFVN